MAEPRGTYLYEESTATTSNSSINSSKTIIAPEDFERMMAKEDPTLLQSCASKRIATGKAIFSFARPNIFTAFVIPDPNNVEDDSVLTGDDSTDDMPPLVMNDESDAESPTSPAVDVIVSTSTASCQVDLATAEPESLVDKAEVARCFSNWSLMLGFVVGCFIQTSSLGANYILTILFGHEAEVLNAHRGQVYMFSLGWSFMTSFMGVLILYFLRSLVSHISSPCEQKRHGNDVDESKMMLVQLEYAFAFGALAGVCVSWTATDLVLGLNVHAYHSILTLFLAVAAQTTFYYVSQWFTADDSGASSQQELLSEPLLSGEEIEKVDREIDNDGMQGSFKIKGILIGLLVGFFIQFSSLGASFLMDVLYMGGGDSGVHSVTRQQILFFSIGWSFFFGTMGVMILLLLRGLVVMVWQHHALSKSTVDYELEWVEKFCLSLEFFFAVGCLLGVNIAWVLTDLGLGLRGHIVRSLLTLAAATVWCKFLAYCFSPAEPQHDEEEDEPLKVKEIMIV